MTDKVVTAEDLAGPPWTDLATYNAEINRGLVHTAEWTAAMAARQAEFDAVQEAQLRGEGWKPFRGGWLLVGEERRPWWRRWLAK